MCRVRCARAEVIVVSDQKAHCYRHTPDGRGFTGGGQLGAGGGREHRPGGGAWRGGAG